MSNEEATIHGFGSQFHQGRPPLLVKITGYRIMTTSTLLTCGTWKAIATYRGKAILSADLDLVAGMILALLVYWLGVYETSDPPCLKWFFHKDYASVLRQSHSSLTDLPLPVVARHRGTSTPSLSDMGDTESSPIPLVPVGTSNYPDGALVNEASSASLPSGGQPSPNEPLVRGDTSIPSEPDSFLPSGSLGVVNVPHGLLRTLPVVRDDHWSLSTALSINESVLRRAETSNDGERVLNQLRCTHPGCNATFSRSNDQKRHTAHVHDRPKKHICVFCRKAYMRRDTLMRHLRISEECTALYKAGPSMHYSDEEEWLETRSASCEEGGSRLDVAAHSVRSMISRITV